jgi:response regulator of citrate/malate metabolism
LKKRLTTDLTRVDMNKILTRIISKKNHFSFEDIEKECQKTLTTADKFLIRSLVVKKFKLDVEYLSSNQLKFYRSNNKICL